MAGSPSPSVDVRINANLSQRYRDAFNQAQQQVNKFTQATQNLTRQVGDVRAFRQQQNATKNAGAEWKAARDKVTALRDAINLSGTATRAQTAALNRAETQVRRTSQAYQDQRARLTQMNEQLKQSGVNVARLSSEYQRLRQELERAKVAEQQFAAQRRQIDRESIQRQQRLDDVIRRQRIAHEANLATIRRQQELVAKMSLAWEKISGFAIGAAAAATVVARPVMQAADYERTVTDIADVVAGDSDLATKTSAKARIEKAINESNIPGGTKREELAAGLGALIAGGQVSEKFALSNLPAMARASFAMSTSAEDIGKMTGSAAGFGVTDMQLAYDQLNRSGQVGGFEAKAVARYLPEQMALGKSVGYSGQEGFVQLLAANQAIRRVSGTEEATARNLINILAKLSSTEFKDRTEDLIIPQKGDGLPTRKIQKGSGKTAKMVEVFDWAGYAMQKREKNVYELEALSQLIDMQLGKDPKYMALKKRLAAAKNDTEYKATLEDMNRIATGSAFGDFFTDRQALLGAIGYGNARGVQPSGAMNMDQLLGAIRSAEGSSKRSADFKKNQTYSVMNTTGELVKKAQYDAYQSVEGAIGGILGGLNNLAIEFPNLAKAVYSTTIALGGIVAFAVGKGFVSGGAAGAAGAAAGLAGTGAKVIPKVAPFVVVGAGGYDAYNTYKDPLLTENQKKTRYLGTGVGTAGAIGGGYAGAAAGAALGAPFGGIGAVPGAIIGGLIGGGLGGWGGGKLGNMAGTAAGEQIWSDSKSTATAAQEAAKAAQEAAKAATIKPNVNQTFNSQMSVTVNEAVDGKMLVPELQQAKDRMDRQQAATMRSEFVAKPQF